MTLRITMVGLDGRNVPLSVYLCALLVNLRLLIMIDYCYDDSMTIADDGTANSVVVMVH